jgi:hypothetical protein
MSSPPDHPSLDIERIVRVLDRHSVEYLLVGGVAAAIHGASRPTFDVDCVPRRSALNLARLAAAMRELNARLHVEGLDDAESAQLPVLLDDDMLARMEISTWRTDAGDLDVLADIPDRHGLRRARLAVKGRDPRRSRRTRRFARRRHRFKRVGRATQGPPSPTRASPTPSSFDRGFAPGTRSRGVTGGLEAWGGGCRSPAC